VNTTQKSSWSARNASSRAMTRAAALLLCVDVGMLRAEGDPMGWTALGRFPVLMGVREDDGTNRVGTLRAPRGVSGVGVEGCEMKGEALWCLYAWLRWGVLGGAETRGAERIGGVGYGLVPKLAATSEGRRPVLTNPSQAE